MGTLIHPLVSQNTWSCEHCTFANNFSSKSCVMCDDVKSSFIDLTKGMPSISQSSSNYQMENTFSDDYIPNLSDKFNCALAKARNLSKSYDNEYTESGYKIKRGNQIKGNKTIFSTSVIDIPIPLETGPKGLEACVREKGLRTPISQGYGFELLCKLGWKPGEAVGKHSDGNPTPITIKKRHHRNARMGLGTFEELNQLKRNR